MLSKKKCNKCGAKKTNNNSNIIEQCLCEQPDILTVCQPPIYLNEEECGRCWECIRQKRNCLHNYEGSYRDWYYTTFEELKNKHNNIRNEILDSWDNEIKEDYKSWKNQQKLKNKGGRKTKHSKKIIRKKYKKKTKK